MKIVLIRHGKTPGNHLKKYVGSTDEGLCEEGKVVLQERVRTRKYPEIDRLYISPMRRCQETAKILYPKIEGIPCEEFRECDFGEFEYKDHVELSENPHYQAWIDSGGRNAFPGGELPDAFRIRCVNEFLRIMGELVEEEAERGLEQEIKLETQTIGMVVHGGTIMSILSSLCNEREGYFDWMVGNGCGFLCEYDRELTCLHVVEEIYE